MEEIIGNRIVEYGIFGMLFIWLLKDTVKKTDEREKIYTKTIEQNQEIIQNQSKALEGIEEIKELLAKGERTNV